MDMHLSSDDLAFQKEVEAFLDTSLDDELRRAGELSSGICGAHEPTMRWHKILHKKGWVAPRWPVEHGGTGWSDMRHYIWSSACARAHAPRLYPMGLGMIGPTLAVCGTPEQQHTIYPSFCRVSIFGVRAIPNQGQVQIWPACNAMPSATAITLSSMAPKSGQATPTTPTIFSALCAPTRVVSHNRELHFC